MLQVREIDPKDPRRSSELARLVASDTAHHDGFSWQDRSPDFFALYRQIGNGDPRFWATFDDAESSSPVAMAGFVPIETSWPNPELKLYYHSDAFTLPKYRIRMAYPLLARAYCDYFEAQDRIPLCYGVEDRPYGIHPIVGLLRKLKMHASFLEWTRFSEAYCGQPVSSRPEPGRTIETLSLAAADSSLKRLWVDRMALEAEKYVLSPRIDLSTLESLARLDPSAELFLHERSGRMTAGLLAVNLEPIRRFRFNGSTSSELWQKVANLRSEGGLTPFRPNDILPVRLLSLVWSEPGCEGDLTRLILTAYDSANRRGYCLVAMRDIPASIFPPELAVVVHSDRRILLSFRQRDYREIMKGTLGARLKWKLDPAFL